MTKRERDVDDEQQQTRDLVSCLTLLSKADQNKSAPIRKRSNSSGSVFVCKTCDREFSSFQALGGHRASHKKPKLMPVAASEPLQLAAQPSSLLAKPKAHGCPICGVEFAIGQALGGHMRRHRDVMNALAAEDRIRAEALPVLKKPNNKRVSISCVELDLDLDLNLAPPGYHLIS